jgi:hypothetical protein
MNRFLSRLRYHAVAYGQNITCTCFEKKKQAIAFLIFFLTLKEHIPTHKCRYTEAQTAIKSKRNTSSRGNKE